MEALRGGLVYDLVHTLRLPAAARRFDRRVPDHRRPYAGRSGRGAVPLVDRDCTPCCCYGRQDVFRSSELMITLFEEFKELARRGTFVPVCKEIVADLLTPVSAFLKIAEDADYAFLLESVEGGEHVGWYSFLGKDPF